MQGLSFILNILGYAIYPVTLFVVTISMYDILEQNIKALRKNLYFLFKIRLYTDVSLERSLYLTASYTCEDV